MYATTDLFDRRIRQGGARKTVVDIYFDGQLVAEDLPVEGGSIRVDRSSAIRRSGSITVPDRSLIPTFNTLLSPYGTEIRIRQGIVYPNGEEELIPLGTFILDTTSWDESSGPIPQIEFFDRAMLMERAEVSTGIDYSGRLWADVITLLMNHFWPGLTVVFGSGLGTGRNPGGTLFTSGSHWDIVQLMARNMGGEIFFDSDGTPVVQKIPVFNETISPTDAVWKVDAGGILQDASRSITREGVYNNVVVLGKAQPEGVQPYYHAENTNSLSPTHTAGPFGGVIKRIDDNTLTTTDQCRLVAQAKLAEYIHLAQELRFTAAPNPAVEEGDIVLMTYLDDSTQLGMIESMNIPLGKGTFSGTCTVARV